MTDVSAFDEHIMLDLETFSSNPNALIASIGACKFDPRAMRITDEFYIAIDTEHADANYDFDINAATVKWWMQQSEEARNAVSRGVGTEIRPALFEFATWCNPTGNTLIRTYMWGNGADFDNVVLANAYRKLDVPRPWSYKNSRCFRTAKALLPHHDMDVKGIPHNALDDAKWQAEYLMTALALAELA